MDPYHIGDFSFQVSVNLNSRVTANAVHVMRTRCAHCDGKIDEEACIALGWPWNALLHRRCMPFVRYSHTWPHPLPLEDYIQRANSMGSTATSNGQVVFKQLRRSNESP
jgi:hypothetical protein